MAGASSKWLEWGTTGRSERSRPWCSQAGWGEYRHEIRLSGLGGSSQNRSGSGSWRCSRTLGRDARRWSPRLWRHRTLPHGSSWSWRGCWRWWVRRERRCRDPGSVMERQEGWNSQAAASKEVHRCQRTSSLFQSGDRRNETEDEAQSLRPCGPLAPWVSSKAWSQRAVRRRAVFKWSTWVAMDPNPDDQIHFIASEMPVYAVEEVLLVSSPGFGALDSGCGKTIIGEDTL